MTDRLKGYVVTLDQDYRTDDAKAIIDAIKMVKGVLTVDPIVSDPGAHMDRQVVRAEYRRKLLEVLDEASGHR